MISVGVLAALLAAFLWTLSSMLWGRIHLTAFVLNAAKNSIGSLLIVIHLLVMSFLVTDYDLVGRFRDMDSRAWIWLSLSGLVGIVIGDTFYFRSLQILGPRRALIMACFSPLFATVLGIIFLKEILSVLVLTGILLTVAGVITVVIDRRADAEAPGLLPGKYSAGLMAGVSGAMCQAVGGMLAKIGLEYCNPVEATFIRLLFAAILCWLLLALSRKKQRSKIRDIVSWKFLRILIPATALGSWLGIWLSQVAYEKTALAVTQTLLSTCPLFAIPVMWVLYRHKANLLAIVGTVAAIIGIALTVSSMK